MHIKIPRNVGIGAESNTSEGPDHTIRIASILCPTHLRTTLASDLKMRSSDALGRYSETVYLQLIVPQDTTDWMFDNEEHDLKDGLWWQLSTEVQPSCTPRYLATVAQKNAA